MLRVWCCEYGKKSKDTGIEFKWTFLCVILSHGYDSQWTDTLTYTPTWPASRQLHRLIRPTSHKFCYFFGTSVEGLA